MGDWRFTHLGTRLYVSVMDEIPNSPWRGNNALYHLRTLTDR